MSLGSATRRGCRAWVRGGLCRPSPGLPSPYLPSPRCAMGMLTEPTYGVRTTLQVNLPKAPASLPNSSLDVLGMHIPCLEGTVPFHSIKTLRHSADRDREMCHPGFGPQDPLPTSPFLLLKLPCLFALQWVTERGRAPANFWSTCPRNSLHYALAF